MKKQFSVLWIFFAVLVFLGCGCRKSSLHYVSSGAQYVVYGDLGKLVNHKFWKSFSQLSAYHRYVRAYLEPLHLTEEELAGNFSFWGTGQEISGVVIILKNDAAPLMQKILALNRENAFVRITAARCLEHDALVINDAIYLVQTGKNTIQIFLGEPFALHTPSRKSKLARMIDEDALFAIAVSDGVLREILNIQGEMPATNLLQICADDRKISLEASWNIENMRDPFPLLQFLEQ